MPDQAPVAAGMGKNGRPVSILLIEDNSADALLIGEMLSAATAPGFTLTTARRLSEGFASLLASPPHLILLDLSLPDSTGFDTFKETLARAPRIPIVVLTGLDDQEMATRAVRQGAQDYLIKDRVDTDLLVRCIRYAIERKKNELGLRVLTSALEQSMESIIITDNRGVIEYVNPSFERLTGYTREEAGGKSPRILKSGRHDQAFYQRLWSSILKGRPFSAIWMNRKRTGELFYEEKTISPIRDPEGNVTHFLSTGRDITQQKLHDALTGLPSRTLFMERLRNAVEHGRRRKDYGFAVLFLDIDRLNIVNDSYGHLTGDQLMIQVANRLQTCVRLMDTVARLGGDEFAVLLDDVQDINDVIHKVESIQLVLRQPFQVAGVDLTISTTIGITLSGGPTDDPEGMLREAETAMYRGKVQGRSRAEIFDPGMRARARERLQIEAELRRAVERNEFRLVFHPVVSLGTRRVCGAEALIRWQHPERGLVGPYGFIPVAEETGLIIPIGEWVLREAARQACAWHAEGRSPILVSVNLSARQFKQPRLAERVATILEETGLPGESMQLEITESTVMENAQQTTVALQELKQLGVQLAIDDFGTGYSSLSYLKRFPIDTLKVDRSFVSDILADAEDAAIVTAIIAMAHSLNLKVVAEGVETEEQIRYLGIHLCDMVQGFPCGDPVAAAEFAGLITGRQIF